MGAFRNASASWHARGERRVTPSGAASPRPMLHRMGVIAQVTTGSKPCCPASLRQCLSSRHSIATSVSAMRLAIRDPSASNGVRREAPPDHGWILSPPYAGPAIASTTSESSATCRVAKPVIPSPKLFPAAPPRARQFTLSGDDADCQAPRWVGLRPSWSRQFSVRNAHGRSSAGNGLEPIRSTRKARPST